MPIKPLPLAARLKQRVVSQESGKLGYRILCALCLRQKIGLLLLGRGTPSHESQRDGADLIHQHLAS